MKASLRVAYDSRLEDLFAAEDHDIGRASYTYRKEEDELVFTIRADDAVAMRTILNAITKLLSIWEKSDSV